MLKSGFWKLAAPCLLIIAAALATPSVAGDDAADIVLGQANFTYNLPNSADAHKLYSPRGVAVDASGHLYVADANNSRVLGWKSVAAFTNGSPADADLVIGQPDFYSTACKYDTGGGNPTANDLCYPYGVAVDAVGNLYVADTSNNRVLEYNTPFAGCDNSFPCVGGPANLVFGQDGSFTSSTANNGGVRGAPTAKSLHLPWGVAVDANGNLYVADTINNRVLEYNTPLTVTATPGSGDTTADLVFGQDGIFTSSTANIDGSTSGANSLYHPAGVAVDANGNLYVADLQNNRVLEYNTPLTVTETPGSGDTTPDLVFGQGGSFTSNTAYYDGVEADSLDLPVGVALDASGDLYVAEGNSGASEGNSRVLEYNTPLAITATPGSGDTTADLVFGQGGSFTSAECNSDTGGGNPTANDLCYPYGVAVDAGGNLYIADTSNNRVLEYYTPLANLDAPNTTADVELGQPDFLHNLENFPDQSSLNYPSAVTIDASTTPNRLYVADQNNSRVLGWKDVTAFNNGAPADLVIGQPDFYSTACNYDTGGGNPTANDDLCYPNGVAVDPVSGDLYVADTNNNRVLEYNAPFAGCAKFPCVGGAAKMVFGQGGDLTSNSANNGGVSKYSLNSPFGVATDGNGDLYVADTNNNRVLEYSTPLTNVSGTTATMVFGQGTSGTSFDSADCNNSGVNASSLCEPSGVAVDASGDLYVADNGNSRVLEYNTPLTVTTTSGSGDTTADLVFGQAGSFSSIGCNFPLRAGTPTARNLCDPYGVAVDSADNLWVADQGNNRVLEYNTPLTTHSVAADAVFGQDDSFTSSDCNLGGTSASATSLCSPSGVAVDSSGNLYVADTTNNRVLKYQLITSMSVTASLAFGNVAVGQTVTKYLTVRNAGHAPLVISSATSSDPEYAPSGTGTCGAIPATVAPETSCTLAVAFTPGVPGAHSATLSINDNTATSPQRVALSGTGLVDLTTSKSSLVFGSVKFGAKAVTSFWVTNHQTQPVTLSETFGGPNGADFSLTGGTCTGTLGANTACTISVTFTPGALGTEGAKLTITDSPDPLSPYTVALSTGPTIPATVTPTTLAYGTLTAKMSSKTKNVTVTNLSKFSLPISWSFSGANAGDFAATAGTCTGDTAAASSSCTVAVTFTPTGGGSAVSASMALTVGSDPSTLYNISLSGTGN